MRKIRQFVHEGLSFFRTDVDRPGFSMIPSGLVPTSCSWMMTPVTSFQFRQRYHIRIWLNLPYLPFTIEVTIFTIFICICICIVTKYNNICIYHIYLRGWGFHPWYFFMVSRSVWSSHIITKTDWLLKSSFRTNWNWSLPQEIYPLPGIMVKSREKS